MSKEKSRFGFKRSATTSNVSRSRKDVVQAPLSSSRDLSDPSWDAPLAPLPEDTLDLQEDAIISPRSKPKSRLRRAFSKEGGFTSKDSPKHSSEYICLAATVSFSRLMMYASASIRNFVLFFQRKRVMEKSLSDGKRKFFRMKISFLTPDSELKLVGLTYWVTRSTSKAGKVSPKAPVFRGHQSKLIKPPLGDIAFQLSTGSCPLAMVVIKEWIIIAYSGA